MPPASAPGRGGGAKRWSDVFWVGKRFTRAGASCLAAAPGGAAPAAAFAAALLRAGEISGRGDATGLAAGRAISSIRTVGGSGHSSALPPTRVATIINT